MADGRRDPQQMEINAHCCVILLLFMQHVLKIKCQLPVATAEDALVPWPALLLIFTAAHLLRKEMKRHLT